MAPSYGDILNKWTTQADEGDLFGLIRKSATASEDNAKRQFYQELFVGDRYRAGHQRGGLGWTRTGAPSRKALRTGGR